VPAPVPVTIVIGTFLGGGASSCENVASLSLLSTSSGGPSSSLSIISMFISKVVKRF
jgi:hypothetical protein